MSLWSSDEVSTYLDICSVEVTELGRAYFKIVLHRASSLDKVADPSLQAGNLNNLVLMVKDVADFL